MLTTAPAIIEFVRHGESTANIDIPYEDHRTIELSAYGQQQARAFAQIAALGVKPALIVTSAFTRAQQTAQPTIELFPDVPLETWNVHEFNTLAQETCRNISKGHEKRLRQDYWTRMDPDHKDQGCGESFRELIDRVDETLERLKTAPAPYTLVFSHGFFIRTVFLRLTTPPTDLLTFMERAYHFDQAESLPNIQGMRVVRRNNELSVLSRWTNEKKAVASSPYSLKLQPDKVAV